MAKELYFFIQCILYFLLEDKSCSSDGVSRVVIVTMHAEMLSQLPTFSLLSCFGMNQEWITKCCKTLHLKQVPVVVSKYFVELMFKYKGFLARSPAHSLLDSSPTCSRNHLF